VVARDAHGRVLGVDPVLTPGERIQLTISGFRDDGRLTVRLGTSTSLGAYVADGSGRVRFDVVVPRGPGPRTYVLAAVGDPPERTGTPPTVKHNRSKDPQIVEAVVPTLGIFLFRIASSGSSSPPTSAAPSTTSSSGGGRSGASGTSTSPSPSTGAGGSGGGSAAGTGVDVVLLCMVGFGGLLGGALVMLAGRRRTHA
jgi:hypothetical protein